MAESPGPVASASDLQCPICHEILEDPKILGCGHTICLKPCLAQLAENVDTVTCPECRDVNMVPEGGVNGFSSNVILYRLLQNAKPETKERATSFCPVCKAEKLLVKCFHCKMVICETCRIKHTTEMEKEVLAAVTEVLSQTTATEISTSVAAARLNLQRKVKFVTEQLESSFSRILDIITESKEKIVKEIQVFEAEENRRILDEEENMGTSFQNIYQTCQEKKAEMNNPNFVPTQNCLITVKEFIEEKLKIIQSQKEELINVPDVKLTFLKEEKIIRLFENYCHFGSEMHDKPDSKSDDEQEEDDLEGELPIKLSVTKRDITDLKKAVGRYGDQPGQFIGISCTAVCPASGNIIVGQNSGYLQLFDEEGVFIRPMKSVPRSCKCAVVTEDDTIIGLWESGYVYIFTTNDKRLRYFQTDCSCPQNIALDSKGNIHTLCGSTVVVHDIQGEAITKYNVLSSDAEQLIILPDDKLMVTYRGPSGNRSSRYFFIFSDQFQLISHHNFKQTIRIRTEKSRGNVGSHQEMTLHDPRYLQGRMKLIEGKYILHTNPDSHSVRVYDLQWQEVTSVGLHGPTQGLLYRPIDAAVTKNGDLVVVGASCSLQFF